MLVCRQGWTEAAGGHSFGLLVRVVCDRALSAYRPKSGQRGVSLQAPTTRLEPRRASKIRIRHHGAVNSTIRDSDRDWHAKCSARGCVRARRLGYLMELEHDTAIHRYIQRVETIPRLSREAELELCRRWRDERDPSAKNELVRAHLRFVVILALKYRRYGLPVAELIAEGNLGLLHAVDKFDPERGLRFLTYAAYWIRAHILNTVTRSWSLVGAGTGALRSKVFFKLRREKARIVNLVGEGEAALDLLAERFDTTRGQVGEMVRRLESRDVSLDAPLLDGGASCLLDTLAAPNCNQEHAYASQENNANMRDLVRSAMRSLDPRERFVVESRLMTDAEETMTLAEVGRRLGVTRERARQLEVRAVHKLRLIIPALSGHSHCQGSLLGSAA